MERAWWKEAIGYELYPKSFKDTDGDGVGDLKGIIEKLPYLHQLGVNLLWICPFYPSPMCDNGYDVADYYGINPQLGTMEEMDNLLETAKNLGMRVIIDMVLNHTSSEHAWFQEALKDPSSKYRDFYIFKRSRQCPSNARSCFGGSVWEPVGDDVWYYHTFDKTQPDLNWEKPELRQEIYQILRFWLEKGISGFRLDAITYIKKGDSLHMAETQDGDGLRDVSEIGLNQPGIGKFLHEMRQECLAGRDVMTVAEAPGVPYDQLGEFIGEDGYFSMIFDFSYADIDLAPGGNWYHQADWSFGELKKLIFHSQLSVQKQGWGAVYLENHDQSRSLNKYFRDKAAKPEDVETRFFQATALATLLLGLRGTVFLYQGEELGMLNCPFDSADDFNDVNTIDQYNRARKAGFSDKEALKFACDRSRDNSRTPFPWNGGEHAGFTGGKPWLKVNPDYPFNHAQRQIEEPKSIFHYYQKLIALRKNPLYLDTLVYGIIKEIPEEAEGVIAFERISENGDRIRIFVNMTEAQTEVKTEKGSILCGNYQEQKWENEAMVLRPYEAVMVGNP